MADIQLSDLPLLKVWSDGQLEDASKMLSANQNGRNPALHQSGLSFHVVSVPYNHVNRYHESGETPAVKLHTEYPVSSNSPDCSQGHADVAPSTYRLPTYLISVS